MHIVIRKQLSSNSAKWDIVIIQYLGALKCTICIGGIDTTELSDDKTMTFLGLFSVRYKRIGIIGAIMVVRSMAKNRFF